MLPERGAGELQGSKVAVKNSVCRSDRMVGSCQYHIKIIIGQNDVSVHFLINSILCVSGMDPFSQDAVE